MNFNTPSDKMISKLLSAATLRQRVIANNVANASTPGFLRSTVRFEDKLRRAFAQGNRDLAKIQPEIVTDTVTPAGFDGNNVTLESELNLLEENRITYELYASILATRGSMIKASLEER